MYTSRIETRSLIQMTNPNPNMDKLQLWQVAIVVKPQERHVSPRTINAMLVGMTRHNPDRLKKIMESEASVESA